MATLGILLLWAGYTTGIFGFGRIKSAYGVSPALSISDLALPSHRATYLAAASTWGNSAPPGTGATSTGGSAVSGAPPTVSVGANGKPAASTQTVVTPTTPGGLKGVDTNGNTYTRTCSTCPWKLATIANIGPAATV